MKKIFIICLILFGMIAISHAQGYKVIVNSSNSQSSITSKDVSAFFLKKKTKWGSGEKVSAVDQSAKSSVRSSFSSAVLRKSTAQVRAYWQQSVFAGGATPPQEMSSDQEVVNYVKQHKGAIGYVSSSANTAGVKVLQVQ